VSLSRIYFDYAPICIHFLHFNQNIFVWLNWLEKVRLWFLNYDSENSISPFRILIDLQKNVFFLFTEESYYHFFLHCVMLHLALTNVLVPLSIGERVRTLKIRTPKVFFFNWSERQKWRAWSERQKSERWK
jgi:hypothetical protein